MDDICTTLYYDDTDERFDYASKLKSTMENFRKSGELLAKYQLEKQIAASREDFQRAKEKKIQMDTFRDNLYRSLRVKELLEPNGVRIMHSAWNYISEDAHEYQPKCCFLWVSVSFYMLIGCIFFIKRGFRRTMSRVR